MNDMKELAPIVLFVYNRIDHTKQTIKALQNNTLAKESELYIYSDGSKNESIDASIINLRKYLKSIDGFKSIKIIERKKNYGLANNIIEGVTDIISKHGSVIVLEDDLITSKYFLDYMNKALQAYKDNNQIYSITGFNFSSNFMKYPKTYKESVFLNIRPMSWSWATWIDRWEAVDWEIRDFDEFIHNSIQRKEFNRGGTDLTRMLKNQMKGKISSWYIRWVYNAYKQKKLTIYPRVSYVNNIGHDATGTHCVEDSSDIYSHTELNYNIISNLPDEITLNQQIVNNFNRGFNTNYFKVLKRKLKKISYRFQGRK